MRRRQREHDVLTPREAAARLGLRTSDALARAEAGRLPGAFRIGKHWRFVAWALPRQDKS